VSVDVAVHLVTLNSDGPGCIASVPGNRSRVPPCCDNVSSVFLTVSGVPSPPAFPHELKNALPNVVVLETVFTVSGSVMTFGKLPYVHCMLGLLASEKSTAASQNMLTGFPIIGPLIILQLLFIVPMLLSMVPDVLSMVPELLMVPGSLPFELMMPTPPEF